LFKDFSSSAKSEDFAGFVIFSAISF
jgi:hypothetical protein